MIKTEEWSEIEKETGIERETQRERERERNREMVNLSLMRKTGDIDILFP